MKKKKLPNHDLETIMPLLIEQWRRLRGIPGPKDVLQTREFRGVVKAVQDLQKRLENNFSSLERDYFASESQIGAYLLYYWVLHYQEGLSLINELPETPNRVLDICSGPAPYAFAALRHGATEVIATDRHLEVLSQGAEICGRYGLPLSIRRWDCLKGSCPVEGKFDLIILSHCIRELFVETNKGWKEQQNAFIQSLLQRLTPNGHLLLVDSSLPHHNERILVIRDHFVKEGVPVQAPCVWRGECPALKGKNNPCYAQRELEKPYLVREIQRGANIYLNSLKMSYLIFRHPDASWPILPLGSHHRVVSPQIESHNGTCYYLCGTDGKKRLNSQLHTIPSKSRAFEYLRRGELISFDHVTEDKGSLNLSNESSIKIEAACGKPLPSPKKEG